MAATGIVRGGSTGSTGPPEPLLPPEFSVPFTDIVWEKDEDGERVELGRGAFGIVYAGRLHGQHVAVKVEAIDDPTNAAGWTKTVVLAMRARCPHITTMLGAVVRAPKGGKTAYYTVMERLAGTLTALLLTPGGAYYDADVALRLMLLADVAGGLAYLHAASVIHADVKPDNVLLTAVTPRSPFPAAKLADFGSSVQRRAGSKTHESMLSPRGTLLYMDPVLLHPTTATASIRPASDVYSFGVLAWQVLAGCTPYEAELVATLPPDATVAQWTEALRQRVLGGKRPPVAALVERGVPKPVVALVEACWAPAQASRPAMADVHRALEAAAVAGTGAAAATPVGSGSGSGSGMDIVEPVAARVAAVELLSVAPPLPVVPPSAAPQLPVPPVLPPPALPPPPPPPPPLLGLHQFVAPVHSPLLPEPLAYEWKDEAVLTGHAGQVFSLALLAGGRLASGDYDGIVRLWDVVRGGEAAAVLEHGGNVLAMAAAPDGCHLAVGVHGRLPGDASSIVVWDTEAVPPAQTAVIDCPGGVSALAVLPDGRLAAGCSDGGVRLVEVGAGAGGVAAMLKGHRNTSGTINALAALPNDMLASGSDDTTVRLWDLSAQVCVATLTDHAATVTGLTVLADGRLASGSSDRTMRLWDVATRTCVAVLLGDYTYVFAVAALPDGRLASAAYRFEVYVWDTRPLPAAAPPAPLLAPIFGPAAMSAVGLVVPPPLPSPAVTLTGHTCCARVIVPLPDGRLASAGADCTVRLWRLPAADG